MSAEIAELRAIVATMPPAPEAMAPYLAKVGERAYTITVFNMIVRLADSFGWDVPEWELLMQRAPLVHDGGYDLGAVLKRA